MEELAGNTGGGGNPQKQAGPAGKEPAPTDSSAPLPPGWEQAIDPTYKVPYYFNRALPEAVQWERPQCQADVTAQAVPAANAPTATPTQPAAQANPVEATQAQPTATQAQPAEANPVDVARADLAAQAQPAAQAELAAQAQFASEPNPVDLAEPAMVQWQPAVAVAASSSKSLSDSPSKSMQIEDDIRPGCGNVQEGQALPSSSVQWQPAVAVAASSAKSLPDNPSESMQLEDDVRPGCGKVHEGQALPSSPAKILPESPSKLQQLESAGRQQQLDRFQLNLLLTRIKLQETPTAQDLNLSQVVEYFWDHQRAKGEKTTTFSVFYDFLSGQQEA